MVHNNDFILFDLNLDFRDFSGPGGWDNGHPVSIPSGGDWVWDEFKTRVEDERLNESLHEILRKRENDCTPTMGELL